MNEPTQNRSIRQIDTRDVFGSLSYKFYEQIHCTLATDLLNYQFHCRIIATIVSLGFDNLVLNFVYHQRIHTWKMNSVSGLSPVMVVSNWSFGTKIEELFRSMSLGWYLSSNAVISTGDCDTDEVSARKSFGFLFQASEICVPSADVMRNNGALIVVAGIAIRKKNEKKWNSKQKQKSFPYNIVYLIMAVVGKQCKWEHLSEKHWWINLGCLLLITNSYWFSVMHVCLLVTETFTKQKLPMWRKGEP